MRVARRFPLKATVAAPSATQVKNSRNQKAASRRTHSRNLYCSRPSSSSSSSDAVCCRQRRHRWSRLTATHEHEAATRFKAAHTYALAHSESSRFGGSKLKVSLTQSLAAWPVTLAALGSDRHNYVHIITGVTQLNGLLVHE